MTLIELAILMIEESHVVITFTLETISCHGCLPSTKLLQNQVQKLNIDIFFLLQVKLFDCNLS